MVFCCSRSRSALGLYVQEGRKGRGRTNGRRRDVGQVGSDTRGVDDIVESELIDERRKLQEEGQRLRSITLAWSAYVGEAGRCAPVQYRPTRRQQLFQVNIGSSKCIDRDPHTSLDHCKLCGRGRGCWTRCEESFGRSSRRQRGSSWRGSSSPIALRQQVGAWHASMYDETIDRPFGDDSLMASGKTVLAGGIGKLP